MKNDELATRRAEAIAGDRCFTKGRLRDEFRMKPAPGAEPVKWYKSAYGGKYAVYRIAGRGGERHCRIPSGIAAGAGTAAGLTDWPAHRCYRINAAGISFHCVV